MSNILTFPGNGPASNVPELSNPSFTGRRWSSRPDRKKAMHHTFVFRSYELIVASPEAELIRDARLDVDKARSKLKSIQQQLQRDREHAAAREDLLTKAEAKLSAAIVAAGSSPPAPASILKPPRRTNSEAMARKRKFNDAMRRRIRIIALSQDLSDEEIKPALTLKHQEIGRFCLQYGVRLEWLLEGEGSILKKGPAGPPMSGAEFAAVVKTLPEAQQRRIETLIDLFMAERDL
jgi:hypothetical protein